MEHHLKRARHPWFKWCIYEDMCRNFMKIDSPRTHFIRVSLGLQLAHPSDQKRIYLFIELYCSLVAHSYISSLAHISFMVIFFIAICQKSGCWRHFCSYCAVCPPPPPPTPLTPLTPLTPSHTNSFTLVLSLSLICQSKIRWNWKVLLRLHQVFSEDFIK